MYRIYFILITTGILLYSVITGFTLIKSGESYSNQVFINQHSPTSSYGNLSPQVTSPENTNSVNGYTFSQTTGTYNPAYGGTVLCTSLCDDGYFSGIALPFTFTFNGAAYTTVSIQENGWLQMGTTTPSGYTPICSGGYPNLISPFSRDLDGNSGVDTLRYLTTGTSPNRVFIVEWWHWGFYSGQTNQIDIQVQLYETSNVIKFVYKPETPATTDAQIGVGLMGATSADFISRTSTTSWTSTTAGLTNCDYLTFSSTIYPPSGLTFTWTPPPPPVPPPPVLVSPANNSTGLQLTDTLVWNASTGAASYRVQLATDSLFTNIVVNDSTVTTTSRIVTGLLNNTKYYWRVNAKNTNGVSAYSTVWNFSTLIISAPLLVAPLNNSINVSLSPLLDWGDVTGAATYNLQLANNSGFTIPIIDLSSLTVSQYQLPASILQPNTMYYWRASATNTNGTSSWSTVWNFTTLPAPNIPVLISPTNGSNILTLTPTLDWSDVIGATSYTLQVATDTNFTNLVINLNSLTISQYSVPTGILIGNTTYYWRVRAVNETGPGPWSARWNFRTITIPPAPNLVAPPNNSTNQPPAVFLDWDSLVAANTYRIQLATDSLFNLITFDTNGVIPSFLQMNPSILSPNGKYYWRVSATNLAGTGYWSAVWNFRINATGIFQYSSGIPKKFKLYNNYPNPFNPATIIKFDIPKKSFIKIKIYDITGKEISNLVDMEMEPGGYEISWNGANYASGVYFYKIEAGDYIKVMKMMLIK